MLQRYVSRFSQISKNSVYIPAGRTGGIQLFVNIIQLRNQLFQDLMSVFDNDESTSSKKISINKIKKFVNSSNKIPKQMEQL